MKLALGILLMMALFVVGLVVDHTLHRHRADQGYVESKDGVAWKMRRMQRYGSGMSGTQEYIPIYEKP